MHTFSKNKHYYKTRIYISICIFTPQSIVYIMYNIFGVSELLCLTMGREYKYEHF